MRCDACGKEMEAWITTTKWVFVPSVMRVIHYFCGKMRDDYPELHNTYDPVESLREEVNRFKETNRFSPMTVTNFFVQAGLTIERLDQLKSTLTHYESALKEAKYSLDACHAHTVHGEVMTREECHLCKTLATINKVLETK